MHTTRSVVAPLAAATLAVAASLTTTAATAAPADRDGQLIKWRGKERTVHLPLTADMIPGAPRPFRKFARAQLTKAWVHALDHEPACKESPTMVVRSLRTDGFALGDFGTYPRPGCNTGGGYVAYWAVRHGEWKEVIGTQEAPLCDRLEQLGFPSELGVHECYDGHDVVPYSHP